jgi:neurabin
LLAIGLEHLKSVFLETGVNGHVLNMMNSDYMRTLGISSEDRARLKKRIKELRLKEEKQRKILDKEMRQKDKVAKKAEKDNRRGRFP